MSNKYVYVAEAFDVDDNRVGRIVHTDGDDAWHDITTTFPSAKSYTVESEELMLGQQDEFVATRTSV